MISRDMNLKNVLEDLGELKKKKIVEKSFKPFLLKIESELKQVDKELIDFFKNPKWIALLSGSLREQVGVNAFNEEYGLIKRKLEGLSKRIGDEIERVGSKENPHYAKELGKIATSLKITADYIPELKEDAGKLANLANGFGCHYISLGQTELPTRGAEIDKEGKVIDNGGICGGMVIEWARQSVAKGTPNYPITSDVKVIDKQDLQHMIRNKDYISEGEKYFNHIDLNGVLSNLADTHPYYVVIRSATKEYSHAIGFRRNGNNIEIFDPNYGYYFFRNVNHASLWLGSLFRSYESSQYPEMIVGLYRSKNRAPLPNDNFESDLTRFSDEKAGYESVIEYYKYHLFYLMYFEGQNHPNRTSDEISGLILSTLQDLNSRLTLSDSKLLMKCISDIKSHKPYLSEYSRLMSPVIYERCKRIRNFPNMKVNGVITPEFKKIIETADDAIKTLSDQCANILKLMKVSPPDKDIKVSRLFVTAQMLISRIDRIISLNIEEKLIAGVSEKSGKLYSVQDAERELNDIIRNPDKNINREHYVLSGMMLVENIQYALTCCNIISNKLKHDIDQFNPESENIAKEIQNRNNIFLLKEIENKIDKLGSLILKVHNEVSHADIQAELSSLYPDQLQPNEMLKEMKKNVISKYSENEIQQLIAWHDLVRDYKQTIFTVIMQDDVIKARFSEESLAKATKYLTDKADHFRKLLIDVIDPKNDKIFDVKDIEKMANFFTRANIKGNIEWLVSVEDLPNEIANHLRYLKTTDNPIYNDMEFKIIQNEINSLCDLSGKNNMTAEDFIRALLTKFGKQDVIDVRNFNVKSFGAMLDKWLEERSANKAVNVGQNMKAISRELSSSFFFTSSKEAKELDPETNFKRIFNEKIREYLISIEKKGAVPDLLIKVNPDFYALLNKTKIAQEDYLNNQVVPVMMEYLFAPKQNLDKLLMVLLEGKKLFPEKGFIELVSGLERLVDRYQEKQSSYKPKA